MAPVHEDFAGVGTFEYNLKRNFPSCQDVVGYSIYTCSYPDAKCTDGEWTPSIGRRRCISKRLRAQATCS